MKNESEKIHIIKGFILRNAFSYTFNTASKKELADEAETIISLVAASNLGFSSDIATTVEKYKKVSEKQAWCIAKAAVENNKESRISYLYEEEI